MGSRLDVLQSGTAIWRGRMLDQDSSVAQKMGRKEKESEKSPECKQRTKDGSRCASGNQVV